MKTFTQFRGLLLLISLLLGMSSGLPQSMNANSIEQFRMRYLLPLIMTDTRNCSINACDALKLISQLLLLIRTTPNVKSVKEEAAAGSAYDLDYDMTKRVKQIESRLRAIEQPVWRLTSGGETEWSHCTSSICRCNPDTKTYTCWNTNLIAVPVQQVIPMNMLSIDLARNSLTTLHKDTFRGLTLLHYLDLSNNALDFLPYDLFQDLDSLTELRLQNNMLEDFDVRIFWKLRNLKHLDLSKNVLANLPEDIFLHLRRVTHINLSDNKLKVFPAALLRDPWALEEFDISRNQLAVLPPAAMQSLSHLHTLDLSWNSISFIAENFFVGLKNLRSLNMHSNRLYSISSSLFAPLTNLTSLDLTMNRIISLSPEAFAAMRNLTILHMGQNSLASIPKGLFRNLTSLTRLTLFSNNLTTLEPEDFQGLRSLEYLMLNNNLLQFVDPESFSPLKSLKNLRIDSNKLQYVPQGAFQALKSLVSVKMDKNPWHCDCRALYLARWIREFITKLAESKPICRGPGDLGGQEVGLLRYDDLCDGQWASMLSLSPRLPVRKNRISTPMNYSDYFNMYLKHIYSTTDEDLFSENTTALPHMRAVKTRIEKGHQ